MKNAFMIMVCIILGLGVMSCTSSKSESTTDSTAVTTSNPGVVDSLATDSIQ